MSAVPPTVGVIGGMGPDATVDLMRRVLALTPAEDDQDHLRMLVDNNPKVPSRIAAIIDRSGPSPAPVLIEMAQGLERQGADFLVMPCNTAHHYHAEIAAAVQIPFLNMMELVATHVARAQPGIRKVGLLASTALQHIHLYEPWFSAVKVEVFYPEQQLQSELMALIRAVKAGRADAEGTAAFNRAANGLLDAGVECLVIACTELSVIADELSVALPVYDASEVLARAVVERAGVSQES
jgi:aspartate racemase